eukprot:scaffold34614_cov34-Prasinocladus_malaysianus.AAC.1
MCFPGCAGVRNVNQGKGLGRKGPPRPQTLSPLAKYGSDVQWQVSLPKAFAPGCQHPSFGSFMPKNSHRCPVVWDLGGFMQRWLVSNK